MAIAKIPYFQVLEKGSCKLCKVSKMELSSVMPCSSERERRKKGVALLALPLRVVRPKQDAGWEGKGLYSSHT